MFTTVVAAADLATHLDDPDWIVFDCRFDLADTDAGRRAYAGSHLPGAHYLHLDEQLAGVKSGGNGRHPLPDPQAFCASLAAFGMRDGMQAVAYDASGGFYAARLWWMLRWIGHSACAVLDGGWEAWRQACLPVTTEVPRPLRGSISCAPRPLAVNADYVMSQLGQTNDLVIDARSAD